MQPLMAEVHSYSHGLLYQTVSTIEDSFDFEGMINGQKSTRRVLQGITERLYNDGISFMALGCEGCDLCEKCTYPTEPCRFPKKAVPSVEACGINVVELSHSIGINYNNGADTVTYFCIILW